jgi:hypothetical protein
MKTIELTDEQYEFFRNIANEMMSQSNRGTEFPLFCVYQKIKVPKPEGVGEFRAWSDSGGEPIYEDDLQDCNPVKEYLHEHPEDKDMEPEDILTEKLDYREVYYNIEDMPVDGQVYFTEKAAQAHIEANGYHYNEPFVYVVSAWRNPELQTIMQFMRIFGTENEQWSNAYAIKKPIK